LSRVSIESERILTWVEFHRAWVLIGRIGEKANSIVLDPHCMRRAPPSKTHWHGGCLLAPVGTFFALVTMALHAGDRIAEAGQQQNSFFHRCAPTFSLQQY
jgi:hypothetical protein